jgi:hypothetical protein
MKRYVVLALTAVGLVVTALCSSSARAATPPVYTKVADQTSAAGFFFGGSVNDSGVATFWTAPNSNGTSPNKIYSGNGGPLFTVADTTGQFLSVGNAWINNAGTVVFGAEVGGGQTGIFARTNAGPFVTIVNTGLDSFDNALSASLSANGNVAFRAVTDANVKGYYRGNVAGGPIVPISEETGPRKNHDYFPVVNDAGTVAFIAYDDNNNLQGLYSGNGGPVFTHGQNGFGFFSGVDLNASGTIALDNSLAIVKVDGTAVTPVATIQDDPYSSFSSITDVMGGVGIANNGTVAFGARLDAGGSGIFTGRDPATDKVIAVGDPLFGSTLTRFGFTQGLSDDGTKVAFYYELANGQKGIAVATIPEPASGVVLFTIIASSVLHRRRPGRQ